MATGEPAPPSPMVTPESHAETGAVTAARGGS